MHPPLLLLPQQVRKAQAHAAQPSPAYARVMLLLFLLWPLLLLLLLLFLLFLSASLTLDLFARTRCPTATVTPFVPQRNKTQPWCNKHATRATCTLHVTRHTSHALNEILLQGRGKGMGDSLREFRRPASATCLLHRYRHPLLGRACTSEWLPPRLQQHRDRARDR
jgi:hypothetical protein